MDNACQVCFSASYISQRRNKSESKLMRTLHTRKQQKEEKTTSTAPATLPEGVVIVTMPRLTMTEGSLG
jgi:hypothetical protein